MQSNPKKQFMTRRELMRVSAALAGGAVAARFYPDALVRAAAPGFPQKSPAEQVAAMRAQFGGNPIEVQKLTENVTLLSGPGGNVVVLNGADGKLMGDTFVQPAWAHLKTALDNISKAPVKTAIDTHWHFDHADNNASLHSAGATLVAHENTKKRMSESHTLAVLNLTFPPSPADALSEQTFKETHKITTNGETVSLIHIPPAHTDSDIYLHFENANVLQSGDVFFNGMYPYIDNGTGGSVSGMIAGATKILAVVDNNTRIVPGHGALGNKADLTKYRDMLTTVRGRLQKIKSSGKTVEEAVTAKPLADLDPVWGKGLFNSDTFIQIAYPAL
ncbi:MAG TPA: MBL fold metallo-hydrolase [Candidatus Saccharimonadales bacterium]|jgi:cyclase|nr:MBL fold metallo-hydrolase [Candidatus Saccharimonadales bacterium]